MQCDDCHMPKTAAGGARYSVHDHLFDFSQPEVACSECHDAADERLKQQPKHAWNLRPVQQPKPLTVEESCIRCHGDKESSWIQEKLKGIRRRL
ncbi:MAG: ammonia-forming cytochrome c nitrite reductase subunit c552 [Acidobacteria bacterium]|nr:ammonia-forming cytochrome c nitrite reductase subunit c552 [Acidobacteriota bacterium]